MGTIDVGFSAAAATGHSRGEMAIDAHGMCDTVKLTGKSIKMRNSYKI